MTGATNITFIVCAGIGILLNVIPLPKAIASGNVGTSMIIVWTEAACLLQFANAVRWNGNINNWAPFWCDFCGYFLIAADVALAGSGVSINRRLYMIVTLDPRRQEKVFNAIVDIVLCLVIPLLSVALGYVVQQYRYFIYEDVGCVPGVGFLDLSFPLVWMLPLLLGTVSSGYAFCTIRASLRQNYKMMGGPGAGSSWSRRSVAIGIVSILYGLIPTSMAIALMATAYPVTIWPGWKTVHSTTNDIIYVPAQKWQSSSNRIACVELRRWTIASLAFIIFLFFGINRDTMKLCRIPFRSVVGRVFSANQQGTDAVPSADESSNHHHEGPSNVSCISVEETFSQRQRASLGLASRSGGVDPDLEIIQLALPPPVARAT